MQGIILLAVAAILGPLLLRSLVSALEHHRVENSKPAEKQIHTAVVK